MVTAVVAKLKQIWHSITGNFGTDFRRDDNNERVTIT